MKFWVTDRWHNERGNVGQGYKYIPAANSLSGKKARLLSFEEIIYQTRVDTSSRRIWAKKKEKMQRTPLVALKSYHFLVFKASSPGTASVLPCKTASARYTAHRYSYVPGSFLIVNKWPVPEARVIRIPAVIFNKWQAWIMRHQLEEPFVLVDSSEPRKGLGSTVWAFPVTGTRAVYAVPCWTPNIPLIIVKDSWDTKSITE
jgi:hypothetical protein